MKNEYLTIGQAERLLVALVRIGLNRHVSARRAERWITANLQPATQRLSVHAAKHHCDRDHQRVGGACYLPDADFADCLRRCGYRVQGDYVYAKEVTHDLR